MDELRCNSLRCRKSLSVEGTAVVTTCSHIFCIDCANALFSTPQICPACETSLPDLDDVVQTTLNPHDSYKTSILSGLSPTTILDIASRALNFYTYQVQQEAAFQALITKNAQERIAVLEAQCNTITREAHAEIGLLKERVTNAEKELEFERRRVHELQETHKANAKAYQKLKASLCVPISCSQTANSSYGPQAQYEKAKQRALLQPGEATAFSSAAYQVVGGGGTPAQTPRGGSARQAFVPAGQQAQQQYRSASSLSHGAAAGRGWTPLQGQQPTAVPFAHSSLTHAQQQQAGRGRRSLLPDPQHGAAAAANAAGPVGPIRNGTGSGGRRGSSGSGGSGGGAHQWAGGFTTGQGGGSSSFLGQAPTGGGGAAPSAGGHGRGGFRPAPPHSRQSR